MKKICMIAIVLLLIFSGQAGASIVEIHIDDAFSLPIFGFGADILAPADAMATDFDISNGSAIPIGSETFWQAWIASNPRLGIQAADYMANSPLGAGLVLTISSILDFTLENFIFADSKGTLYDSDLFRAIKTTVGDTTVYTIANVPIPSVLLLLSSGLLGLIGIRRKTIK